VGLDSGRLSITISIQTPASFRRPEALRFRLIQIVQAGEQSLGYHRSILYTQSQRVPQNFGSVCHIEPPGRLYNGRNLLAQAAARDGERKTGTGQFSISAKKVEPTNLLDESQLVRN
jgi:hypothetical protein